ncbi:hypothetical protein B4098_1377 [Heyndrickxia coagulans]|uniref:Uncharacterized protein n=1 Tax=Heyndrickxia coagulans TaxID=1398 RepID=A0A150JY48_HEYCO|nr:hypothetical protein B4098_1377 [Heyndrickxia coagulans]
MPAYREEKTQKSASRQEPQPDNKKSGGCTVAYGFKSPAV